MFTNIHIQKKLNSIKYIYFYLHTALIKTDLKTINVDTASIYLKVSVFKKIRQLRRCSIASISFILRIYSKVRKENFSFLEKRVRT